MKYFTVAAVAGSLLAAIALVNVTLRNSQPTRSVSEVTSVNPIVHNIEMVSFTAEDEASCCSKSSAEAPAIIAEAEAESIEIPTGWVLEKTLPPAEPFPAEFFNEPCPGEVELTAAVYAAEEEQTLSLFDSVILSNNLPVSVTVNAPEQSPAVQLSKVDPLPLLAQNSSTQSNSPAEEEVEAEEKQESKLTKYPIWLLIKPDGVQFLQTREEIAIHQNQIPEHAFLVCCQQASFEANTVSDNREFQLTCKDFALLGHYGTKQFVEIKGMSLDYSTQRQQIRLKGDKDAPVVARLNHPDTETLMQAEVINLALKSDFIPKTQYDQRDKPSTRTVLWKTNFQMNAANISSLSISGVGVPVVDESENTMSKGKVNLLPTY